MISVLYVDDEVTLLEVTKIYMERGGDFFVDTSTLSKRRDPETRVGTVRCGHFRLPDAGDGRSSVPEIPPADDILPSRSSFSPGKGREEVAIDALNSGADFYLQKGGEPKSQFAELKNKILMAVTPEESRKSAARIRGKIPGTCRKHQ